MDEKSVSLVHDQPNHEPIAEGHCETTYGAKCEWRQMMEDRWLSVDDIAAYGNFGCKRSTSGCEAAVTQKNTKAGPRNDGKKNMSEMNLFHIKSDAVLDLEGVQNRDWPEPIRHQNKRSCCV